MNVKKLIVSISCKFHVALTQKLKKDEKQVDEIFICYSLIGRYNE